MPIGITMFSFDFFGLSRHLQAMRSEQEGKVEQKSVEAAEADVCEKASARNHEIFFWGMYPIL
ncbi:hypothetical protein HFC70_01255 [Agrobacterium sp. a22-2]|uniref:hypothetical protein n=1 Tax=Agrobacterium sp. a22-2 TaxID=2283840 RepID=UPI001446BE85|nr:hypothetical protein [Agrobacterium sp. a22-2]NKN34974.1 hypothetical protein [Agrobacterium sp. a22-2]